MAPGVSGGRRLWRPNPGKALLATVHCAVVTQTISGYKFAAMCQQRQQRRPVRLLAGRGLATPPAPFRLRVLRVTYSQPIRLMSMSNKHTICVGANNVSYETLDSRTRVGCR